MDAFARSAETRRSYLQHARQTSALTGSERSGGTHGVASSSTLVTASASASADSTSASLKTPEPGCDGDSTSASAQRRSGADARASPNQPETAGGSTTRLVTKPIANIDRAPAMAKICPLSMEPTIEHTPKDPMVSTCRSVACCGCERVFSARTASTITSGSANENWTSASIVQASIDMCVGIPTKNANAHAPTTPPMTTYGVRCSPQSGVVSETMP
mmetsp:Transcript_34416/g.75620  ORF Transcript_34416/g.75620 Transcript_34416/m.75620 type:complete len:217 (-) Transcript_34416:431-1081(-)